MNRMSFKYGEPMNLVHRTKEGSQLWLGDYYAATNIPLLKQKDIRSVLTAASFLEISYPKEHNINHKIINALDIPTYKMTPHFEEAYRFIEEALRKGHILVHCAAGISRSTTFVMVYLMRMEGMTFNRALDYVRSKRSKICPNYGFQNQLRRYQLNLKKLPSKQSFNYSTLSQKKAVFDFINNQHKPSVTFGSKFGIFETEKQMPRGTIKINNYSGFLRGKSINQAPKQTVTTPNFHYVSSSLAKKFQHFRQQHPKIVTIKK